MQIKKTWLRFLVWTKPWALSRTYCFSSSVRLIPVEPLSIDLRIYILIVIRKPCRRWQGCTIILYIIYSGILTYSFISYSLRILTPKKRRINKNKFTKSRYRLSTIQGTSSSATPYLVIRLTSNNT
jgi:hypothetical protein